MERKVHNKRKLESISNVEEEKHGDSHVMVVDQLNKKLRKKNAEEEEKGEEDGGQSSNNKMQRIILWFRNDLRLHDNAVLHHAVQLKAKHKEVVPVYCFDPRFFTKHTDKYDTRKCGLIRTRFILESV
jgi:deoxyribodipyrimidine photo-lyase